MRSTATTSTERWSINAAPSSRSMQSIRTMDGKAIAFVNRGPQADFHARVIAAAPELLENVRRLVDLEHGCQEEIDDDAWKSAYADAQTTIVKWALGG